MADLKVAAAMTLAALATVGIVASVAVQVLTWRDVSRRADVLQATLVAPRYDYKVVSYDSDIQSRTGADAMKPAMVTVSEKELTKLGGDGWEVVTSYLEEETAFPNFGDERYVTGLQTNTRPQRLVLVLRHRAS